MSGAPSARTNKIAGGPDTSHIVFNPPPTLPNVYHTPLVFMPPSDPRRKMYQSAPSLYNLPQSSSSTSSSSPTFASISPSKLEASAQPAIMTTPGTALREVAFSFPSALAQRVAPTANLPPIVTPPSQHQRVLTQDEVEEIRHLRATNPDKYTVNYLKKKFECSEHLIMGIQSAPMRIKKAHTARLEARWAKKSDRRKLTLRDRLRRKEMWARDA